MHDCFDDFREVYFALCKSVDTPYSLSCYLRWKYRCFTDAKAPVAAGYDDPRTFAYDYLVYSWPSKARYNLEGRDLKGIALEGFIADEDHNFATEDRLKNWMSGATQAPALVEKFLPRIQRKIQSVLGSFSLRKVVGDCRIGNGASVSLSRRKARFDKKMTTLPLTVSPDAFELARSLIESDPHWASALLRMEVVGPFSLIPKKVFELTDYNLFDTVPKSLKTDRTIAKEPVLNGILQQGVHTFLRRRLLRIGVDLRDQTRNQYLAQIAHWAGLATLDLKSASNSVTESLMFLLFPHDWYVYLDILRSHNTLLPDGTMHRNRMFSSMGNAYTFEVETLIFWAIASAVVEERGVVSVYGDDIIVPQFASGEVVELLKFFGFRINSDKSFTEGRFFESCGKHYFDGCDVTPAFQKEAPRGGRLQRIRANNRLVRWALRLGDPQLGILDGTVKSACSLIRRAKNPKDGTPSGPVFMIEQDSFAMDPEWGGRMRFDASGSGRIWGLREHRVPERTRQQAGLAYYLRIRTRREQPSAAQLVPSEHYHRLATVLSNSRYRSTLLEVPDADEGLQLSESVDEEQSGRVVKVLVEVIREDLIVAPVWS